MTWKLKRTRQCAKCPWKVGVNPHQIPDGYSVDKHCALDNTIARGSIIDQLQQTGDMHVMACHEQHDAHCVGWLVNQLGAGNNILMRLRMRDCENGRLLKTVGPQHERFEDTIPD